MDIIDIGDTQPVKSIFYNSELYLSPVICGQLTGDKIFAGAQLLF